MSTDGNETRDGASEDVSDAAPQQVKSGSWLKRATDTVGDLNNLAKGVVGFVTVAAGGAALVAGLGGFSNHDDAGPPSPTTSPSVMSSAPSPSSAASTAPAPDVTAALTHPGSDDMVGQVVSSTSGTIENLPAEASVFLGLSREGDPNQHPMDVSCVLDAQRKHFSCGDLYVGNPGDAGLKFSVYVIVADPAATSQLLDYGQRDKHAADAYAGLKELPSGSAKVAQVVVRRV